MMIIGLTGGIGSGKSTVAWVFEELGIPVIYADKLTHEAYETQEVRDKVMALMGTIDRGVIRRLVFRNPSLKKDLELILNPYIQAIFHRKLKEYNIEGKPMVIYENALLYRNDGHKLCKVVIVADCPIGQRVKRVMARDRIPYPLVARMIRSQGPYVSQALLKADFLIDTNIAPEEVVDQVTEIAWKLRAL